MRLPSQFHLLEGYFRPNLNLAIHQMGDPPPVPPVSRPVISDVSVSLARVRIFRDGGTRWLHVPFGAQAAEAKKREALSNS